MDIIINQKQYVKILTEKEDTQTKKQTWCKSFDRPGERTLCGEIQKILSSSLSIKNTLKSRVNRLYKTFEGKQLESELFMDNIKNQEDLFNEKINHLRNFIGFLPSGCSKLKMKAEKSLKDLESKGRDILLYVRETETGKEIRYSYLNRLNTNYTALSILITEYAINKNLINETPEDLIDMFIKNSDVDEFMFDVFNRETPVSGKILNIIDDTRMRGNDTEEEFKKYLESLGVPFEDFSDDFGSVDFLGVDLLVKFPDHDYYSPVQVKSKSVQYDDVMISNYDEPQCKCYLIYPDYKGEKPYRKVGSIENIKVKGKVQEVSCQKLNMNKDGNTWFCNGPYPNVIEKDSEFIIFKGSGHEVKTMTSDVKKYSKTGSFFWSVE